MYRFLSVLILFLLTGCGPRYVIHNQYIPPASSAMQGCLTNCTIVRQSCQDRCQRDYQFCLEDAFGRAKVAEREALRDYDMALMRYNTEFLHYQHALHSWERDYYDFSRDYNHFALKCEKEKDGYACKKRDELKSYLKRLNRDRPREPRVPMRVSFDQILADQQRLCSNDCGCDTGYDHCYVGCGGQVIPHKICVENCD
ncbi:MAG: hypothetical protein PHR87_00930 [Sulfurospirillaceae bacterium]|nr:hypothetical protein [Sulfurospirillaceae bacterium]